MAAVQSLMLRVVSKLLGSMGVRQEGSNAESFVAAALKLLGSTGIVWARLVVRSWTISSQRLLASSRGLTHSAQLTCSTQLTFSAQLTFSGIVLFFATSGYAQFVPQFDGRQFGLEMVGEYFYTDENLSGTDGSRVDTVGDSFQTFSVRGAADYSLRKNWLVGVGAEIVNASSENQNFSVNNLEADRSATELNNFSVFTHYELRQGTLRLIPTLKGTFTVQEVNPNTNNVVTGEGANQAELGAWGLIETGGIEPYIYGGYRYQDDGRAHLMPWRLGAQFNLSRFFLRSEVGGHLVIQDDKYNSRRLERTNVTNRVNAGSFRYYAVNPNLIEARVEAGIPVSRELDVVGGATHTLAGESVAYGYSFYAGIRYAQGSKDYRGVGDDELAVRMAEDEALARQAERAEREERARQGQRSGRARGGRPGSSEQAPANRRRRPQNEERSQPDERGASSGSSSQNSDFVPSVEEDYDPSLFEKKK